MKRVTVKVKKLPNSEGLALPEYMSDAAAGMDLCASVDTEETIAVGETKLIPTGIAVSLPEGYEAQIRPRSGLALKHNITLPNSPGTIDADYRGEIKVIMHNAGKEAFTIKRGDRIAQMVINEIAKAEFKLVTELDDTKRSDGGFGHTGS